MVNILTQRRVQESSKFRYSRISFVVLSWFPQPLSLAGLPMVKCRGFWTSPPQEWARQCPGSVSWGHSRPWRDFTAETLPISMLRWGCELFLAWLLYFRNRNSFWILIKKRKIKEQMEIILAQYFEIFQISSSGKISKYCAKMIFISSCISLREDVQQAVRNALLYLWREKGFVNMVIRVLQW